MNRRDKRKTRRINPIKLEFVPAENQYEPETVQSPAPQQAVRRVLAQELTARQKEYFRLYYEEQFSMTEIAALCDVSPATVSRTLKRARDRVRRVMQYYY